MAASLVVAGLLSPYVRSNVKNTLDLKVSYFALCKRREQSSFWLNIPRSVIRGAAGKTKGTRHSMEVKEKANVRAFGRWRFPQRGFVVRHVSRSGEAIKDYRAGSGPARKGNKRAAYTHASSVDFFFVRQATFKSTTGGRTRSKKLSLIRTATTLPVPTVFTCSWKSTSIGVRRRSARSCSVGRRRMTERLLEMRNGRIQLRFDATPLLVFLWMEPL